MKHSPLRQLSRPIWLAATLLLLLLQVQSVFACEMMAHSGPVSECCCGEMTNGQAPDCDCCTVETELSLKADYDDNGIPLPATHYSVEQPDLHGPPDYRWPPIQAPPANTATVIFTPEAARPGRLVWLTTQRLRI